LTDNDQPSEPVEPTAPREAHVSLRDYQADAIQACLDAFDRGLTRIGVSSPTGSGKTTMFMHLIPAVRDMLRSKNRDGGGKTLILVSGIELASQTEVAAMRILGDEWSVEVEQGSRKASGRADVYVTILPCTVTSSDQL
jgi:ATP-dependent helicase IRC3